MQALELDPDLAEAHAAMGWLLRIYDWNWSGAENHFRRAIELAPDDPTAYKRLGYLYVTLGRTKEAVNLSSKVKELDPLDSSHAWFLYCDRQFEASAQAYAENLKSAVSINAIREANLGMAIALMEIGKLDEAVRLLRDLRQQNSDSFAINSMYAIALRRTGDTEGLAKLLPWLEQKAAESPGRWIRLAYVYAAMERNEDALASIERGLHSRDDRLMWIKTTPFFDELRDHPSFQASLAKMQLE
jgi:tetratricopeptide (TPR) repeat protein